MDSSSVDLDCHLGGPERSLPEVHEFQPGCVAVEILGSGAGKLGMDAVSAWKERDLLAIRIPLLIQSQCNGIG